MSNLQLLRWMFSFLGPVRARVVVACAVLTTAISLEILAVRQTATVVNAIQAVHAESGPARPMLAWLLGDDPQTAALRWALFALAGLTLATGAVTFVREIVNARLSMNMVFYIREAIYDRLQRVGLRFHDAVSTGELINRALSDLQNVRQFIQSAVLTTLEILLIVGGYIVLLLTRSPWAALLALAPLPFWAWYILRFSRKVQPAQAAVMEAGDRNVSILTENIAGVHVVRAFATEPQEIAKYGANCDDYLSKIRQRIRMYANFTPVVRSISMASHLALFLLAGILLLRRELQVGDILMLGAAMGAILTRLGQVSMINDQYQNAIVSGRRLHEVLSAAPTVPESPAARPLPAGAGAVRFENVSFGYEPELPVLRDVTFDVPAGSVVALVGPTGAGKSTLVQLLARFYDVQAGRILIDGMDLRDATLDSLRSQVAFVFQETYLFSDSVRANIAYGRPSVAGQSIRDAARIAQAHEFIEQLPRTYDEPLGDRGATLSGGQRQRLAIARALLANPRILILDDATASVDPETEVLIHRDMRSIMQGRTTFLIAHRISTVRRADLVVVLENGRVTQIGTHDELMKRDGHYRDIAAVQLYGDQLDTGAEGDNPSHLRRAQNLRRVAAERVAAQEAEERAAEAQP